jgi:hypothetical protein
MRALAAILCILGGVLLLLCWGMGMKFWSILGVILVVMALAAAYFIATRDYIAGATPAAVTGIVTIFVLLPPRGLMLLAVVMLFAAAGLAYVLYEVG